MNISMDASARREIFEDNTNIGEDPDVKEHALVKGACKNLRAALQFP